ncbi:hypothetical protein HanHA300_Chr15g0564911 [Helianthus annuus]|nr:hypothetical protein HanHA300_Chr15g0564911 [Helianthus annuus]KAJ0473072.1 hypothetical protein HanHA89_Chr15g0614211 [Helianthus annuus]KAJ0648675.1 hypothetical protein HanLR1_Chr15g0575581 [Helianthus annuus]KAJ0652489.1 hypothetical protein HanOQP8_Chr15g0572741 [Helianthus annuus]
MKVKTSSEPVQGTPKVVPNWYLRSFSSGNSLLVPSIICSFLTTSFIRTTSLSHNFFCWFSFGYLLMFFFSILSFYSYQRFRTQRVCGDFKTHVNTD